MPGTVAVILCLLRSVLGASCEGIVTDGTCNGLLDPATLAPTTVPLAGEALALVIILYWYLMFRLIAPLLRCDG